MEFDQDFEDELLAQCLVDLDFVRTASATLDAHHFCTEQHSWIWNNIKDVFEEHGELLTRPVILNRARAAFRDEDERMATLELAGKLTKIKPASPKAALGELGEFVRFVQLQSSMEEAIKHLDKGKISQAYETVGRVISLDARPTGYEIAKWIEDFGDRLKESKRRKDHPDLYPVIGTGIKGLDKIIQGIRLTELGLVAATTNRGKSIFGVHLGYHGINQGFGVAHFSTEMHHSQVMMRYDSRWTRMVHAKFKAFDFNRAELRALASKLKKAHEKYKGLLRVISIPVTGARLPLIRRLVHELRSEMRNLKMVILDSADHIQAEQHYRDKRYEIADVYWGTAGWAAEEQLAIWATTQLGKQAADRVGTSEDVADNYDKSRIADIVVTLNRPKRKSRATPKVEVGEDGDEEADKERVAKATSGADLELQLTKYRDGKADVRIPLNTDLKRMIIRDREEAA